ncbi:MAG TPA: hypothetical protein DEB06_11410 [Phycisphaerales bacterium]|nr:hypothetical protein [Phycisphaerales bacterium]
MRKDGGARFAPDAYDGRRFALRLLVQTDALEQKGAPLQPWARSSFDALPPDAYWRSIESPRGAGADLGLTRGVRELIEWSEDFGPAHLLDGRSAVVLAPTPDGLTSAVVAWESSDVEAIAPAGDALIARRIRPLFTEGADAPAIDLGGAFPAAQRTVDLSATSLARALKPAFDAGPVLSWSFVRGRGAPEATKSGWWTLGLGKDAVALVSKALTTPPLPHPPGGDGADQRAAPWISIGSARPSALVRELERRKIPLPPEASMIVNPARVVERIEWELLQGDARTVVGVGALVLEPAGPGEPGEQDKGASRGKP